MRTGQDKKHWERYLPAKRQTPDPAGKPELPRCLRLLLKVLTAIERSALRIETFCMFFFKFVIYLSMFILGMLMLGFSILIIVS